ncbi:sulfurtransferase TusA family protein [Paenibacillus sp. MAH-36]|uniref:Sulfurtransferase TusA family protein n=1 Tax=Paenibacillus violae TaxID=3077234 RepID=A0ABU3RPP6_9BACL|nr:sulfurtransferase TusA family protein [Paenibacillus sp. PFR10]MDU0206291.1 sulfurtransferase TusA family protein [Paenibacillus sp. PFR10]
MTTLQVNRLLECEGLACPLPVVRTKKAMDEMNAGEVLEVRATDKGSIADLKSWSSRTGHQYLGLKEENGVFHQFIRKAELADTKAEKKYPHTATNEEVHTKISSGEAIQIIDVREPAEYAFGRIPGAISIPLGQFEEKLNGLDPSKAYYVVCRTGNRSDMACQILSDKGFQNVKNVTPGMTEWSYDQEQD